MSTEIATWSMIHAKIPSFPSPTAGRENECLTKTEIQSWGGENLSIKGSYSNNECIILEDIEKITWEYTFNVQPASLSFAAMGGTQLVTVTSYKRKYIDNIYSGIQQNVGFNPSSFDSWIRSSGTSVTVQENAVTSDRSATVKYTQNESGNLRQIMVGQEKAVVTYEYSVYLAYGDLVEADRIELVWSTYDTVPKNVYIEAYQHTFLNGCLVESIKVDWTYEKIESYFGHYSVSRNADNLKFTPVEQNLTTNILTETFSITAVGASYPQASIICYHKYY